MRLRFIAERKVLRVGRMAQQQAGHQGQDVAFALAQWGHAQLESANAEIQIFAKLAIRNGHTQVFVGGRNDANINGHLAFRAQACEQTFLQNAQQLGLQVHRHLANFIQEQSAALGLFKQSFEFFLGAGECAFFVAKQHVVNQLLWQSGAVQTNKRATCTLRRLVQHTRQNFFTRTSWAFNEGCHIGLRHTLGQGQQMTADRIYIDHAFLGCGRSHHF